MGISACIIAKNEQQHIGRCLQSLQGVADEIIVVDTGSTDETIEIARQFGCRVFSVPWQNDFSAARNVSLDQATQDWIFIIDCDEELTPSSKELVVDLCKTQEDIEGFGVLIENMIGGIPSYTSTHLRLVRNDPRYRFEGSIHEQIGDSILRIKPEANFLSSQIVLQHYGYENDPLLVQRKTQRNLSMLLAVPPSQQDGMYFLHLGAEYVRLDRPVEAAQIFRRGYDITQATQPYYPTLAHKLIDALYRSGEYAEGVAFCDRVLGELPDYRAIYFLKFSCLLQQGQLAGALQALLCYRDTPERPSRYPVLGYGEGNDIDGLIAQMQNDLEKRAGSLSDDSADNRQGEG